MPPLPLTERTLFLFLTSVRANDGPDVRDYQHTARGSLRRCVHGRPYVSAARHSRMKTDKGRRRKGSRQKQLVLKLVYIL
jgi:hypothetical protein